MSLALVSREAGVSMATVSRVINGNPSVKPELVEAVVAAIRKVGYVPPEQGRIGRPRASGVRRPAWSVAGSIAVLFPDINQAALRTPLSGVLLAGIQSAVAKRSLSMVVTGLTEDGHLPPCVTQRQVDGVIIRGGAASHPANIDALGKVPHVWLFEDRYLRDDCDRVQEDNETIGEIAAAFLLGRGNRSAVMLHPWAGHPSLEIRARAFESAVRRAGAAYHGFVAPPDEAGAARLVEQYLSIAERPRAVYVPGADDQVIRVYRELERRGLRSGREIDLIVGANVPVRMTTLDPLLPHIDVQAEAIGQAATDTLFWRLRHPEAAYRRVLIAPKLILPESPGT